MDKSRKNLFTFSIIIVGLAVLSLVDIAAELYLFGFKDVTIPEGAPENIVEITKNFLFVFSFLMLLPQFYVGIKGACVAKKSGSSKGHIFWATVILIFALGGIVYTIASWVNGADSYESLSLLFDYAFDAAVYSEFLVYARRVAKGC